MEVEDEFCDSWCGVCRDPYTDADNPIVFCDEPGCTNAVHCTCGGILNIPEGEWRCRTCEAGFKGTCWLCGQGGGIMKPVIGRGVPAGAWGHLICGLALECAKIDHVPTMEPIIVTDPAALEKSKLSPCSICKKAGGGLIKCSRPRCFMHTAFHPLCAAGANWRLTLRCQQNEKGEDVLCIEHEAHLEGDGLRSDGFAEDDVIGLLDGLGLCNREPWTRREKQREQEDATYAAKSARARRRAAQEAEAAAARSEDGGAAASGSAGRGPKAVGAGRLVNGMRLCATETPGTILVDGVPRAVNLATAGKLPLGPNGERPRRALNPAELLLRGGTSGSGGSGGELPDTRTGVAGAASEEARQAFKDNHANALAAAVAYADVVAVHETVMARLAAAYAAEFGQDAALKKVGPRAVTEGEGEGSTGTPAGPASRSTAAASSSDAPAAATTSRRAAAAAAAAAAATAAREPTFTELLSTSEPSPPILRPSNLMEVSLSAVAVKDIGEEAPPRAGGHPALFGRNPPLWRYASQALDEPLHSLQALFTASGGEALLAGRLSGLALQSDGDEEAGGGTSGRGRGSASKAAASVTSPSGATTTAPQGPCASFQLRVSPSDLAALEHGLVVPAGGDGDAFVEALTAPDRDPGPPATAFRMQFVGGPGEGEAAPRGPRSRGGTQRAPSASPTAAADGSSSGTEARYEWMFASEAEEDVLEPLARLRVRADGSPFFPPDAPGAATATAGAALATNAVLQGLRVEDSGVTHAADADEVLAELWLAEAAHRRVAAAMRRHMARLRLRAIAALVAQATALREVASDLLYWRLGVLHWAACHTCSKRGFPLCTHRAALLRTVANFAKLPLEPVRQPEQGRGIVDAQPPSRTEAEAALRAVAALSAPLRGLSNGGMTDEEDDSDEATSEAPAATSVELPNTPARLLKHVKAQARAMLGSWTVWQGRHMDGPGWDRPGARRVPLAGKVWSFPHAIQPLLKAWLTYVEVQNAAVAAQSRQQAITSRPALPRLPRAVAAPRLVLFDPSEVVGARAAGLVSGSELAVVDWLLRRLVFTRWSQLRGLLKLLQEATPAASKVAQAQAAIVAARAAGTSASKTLPSLTSLFLAALLPTLRLEPYLVRLAPTGRIRTGDLADCSSLALSVQVALLGRSGKEAADAKLALTDGSGGSEGSDSEATSVTWADVRDASLPPPGAAPAPLFFPRSSAAESLALRLTSRSGGFPTMVVPEDSSALLPLAGAPGPAAKVSPSMTVADVCARRRARCGGGSLPGLAPLRAPHQATGDNDPLVSLPRYKSALEALASRPVLAADTPAILNPTLGLRVAIPISGPAMLHARNIKAGVQASGSVSAGAAPGAFAGSVAGAPQLAASASAFSVVAAAGRKGGTAAGKKAEPGATAAAAVPDGGAAAAPLAAPLDVAAAFAPVASGRLTPAFEVIALRDALATAMEPYAKYYSDDDLLVTSARQCVANNGYRMHTPSMENGQLVYCTCRTPDNPSHEYISCEYCGEWFHYAHAGVAPFEALYRVLALACRTCIEDGAARRKPRVTLLRPVEDPGYVAALACAAEIPAAPEVRAAFMGPGFSAKRIQALNAKELTLEDLAGRRGRMKVQAVQRKPAVKPGGAGVPSAGAGEGGVMV